MQDSESSVATVVTTNDDSTKKIEESSEENTEKLNDVPSMDTVEIDLNERAFSDDSDCETSPAFKRKSLAPETEVKEEQITLKEELQIIIDALISPTHAKHITTQKNKGKALQNAIRKLQFFNNTHSRYIEQTDEDAKEDFTKYEKIQSVIQNLKLLKDVSPSQNKAERKKAELNKKNELQTIVQELQAIQDNLKNCSRESETHQCCTNKTDLRRIKDVIFASNHQELKLVTKGVLHRLVLQNIPYSVPYERIVAFISSHAEGLEIIMPRLWRNKSHFAGTLVAEFSNIEQAEKFEKEMNGFMFEEGSPLEVKKDPISGDDYSNLSDADFNLEHPKRKSGLSAALLKRLDFTPPTRNDAETTDTTDTDAPMSDEVILEATNEATIEPKPKRIGISAALLKRLDVRSLLVKQLFVSNVDGQASETDVKELFAVAGIVVSVQYNPAIGQAIVEMSNRNDAMEAISMLHSQQYFDKILTVRLLSPTDPQNLEVEVITFPRGLKTIGSRIGLRGSLPQVNDVMVAQDPTKQATNDQTSAKRPLSMENSCGDQSLGSPANSQSNKKGRWVGQQQNGQETSTLITVGPDGNKEKIHTENEGSASNQKPNSITHQIPQSGDGTPISQSPVVDRNHQSAIAPSTDCNQISQLKQDDEKTLSQSQHQTFTQLTATGTNQMQNVPQTNFGQNNIPVQNKIPMTNKPPTEAFKVASVHCTTNPVMILNQLQRPTVITYQTSKASGSVAHASCFVVTAEVDGRSFSGEANSIKKAKFVLAKTALKEVYNIDNTVQMP